jgi:hypothetical protein
MAQAPEPVGYRDIAWWAETADGYRDEDLVVCQMMVEGTPRLVLERRAVAEKERLPIVMENIRVSSIHPNRPKVTKIMVEVGGVMQEAMVDGVPADAVFCSESAIEKFLLRYYEAQRLLTEEQWASLRAALMDERVPAIAHVAPSRAAAVGMADWTMRAFGVVVAEDVSGDRPGKVKCLSLRDYAGKVSRRG